MRELNFISRKQERVLMSLLAGQSVALAARNEKISESTIWRWLKQEDFKQRWLELRAIQTESAIARLQALSHKAVDTIERLLDSENAPTSARVAIACLTKSVASVDEFDTRQKVMELWKERQKQ
jgi:hypothetical protein